MKLVLPVVSVLALALAGCSSSWNPFSSNSSNEQTPMAAAPSPAAMAAAPAPTASNNGMAAANSADMTAMQSRDLKQAQRTLKSEGLYKGKIDGKSGPLTIAAIQSFQKKHDLKPTGWLDQDTSRALGSLEAQASPATGHQSTTR